MEIKYCETCKTAEVMVSKSITVGDRVIGETYHCKKCGNYYGRRVDISNSFYVFLMLKNFIKTKIF
jgi:hypothetical protein